MEVKRRQNNRIITQPIIPLLVKLTIPSIFGMLGMMIFNIVDTYFVGQIGTIELAAISFTFPVVMVVGSLNLGIGIGVMSLFSRASGKGNVEEERKLATASILLGVLLAAVITVIGLFTIDPLFTLLGAKEEVLPYIRDYMQIWYYGSVFVVIPMVGDHILRGLGDTKTPSFVMLTASITNLIFDPLLIFGIGPFPVMGIKGAAIATIFSRMITMVVSLAVMIFREKLVVLKYLAPSVVLKEWKSIIFIGLPNSLIKMITPFSAGVFTGILAVYGNETVAGFGVAAKIEMFCMTIVMSLSVTAAVFTGQNLGAGNMERVKKGIKYLNIFSIILGFAYFIVLIFTGRFIGSFFNDDHTVQNIIGTYLAIVSISYGLFSIIQITVSILNSFHKPLHAGIISAIQAGLSIVLAFILSFLLKANGVFISISLSYILTGIISFLMLNFILKDESKNIIFKKQEN